MNEFQDLDIREIFESADRRVEICAEEIAVAARAKKQRRATLATGLTFAGVGLAVVFLAASFLIGSADNSGGLKADLQIASTISERSDGLDTVLFEQNNELIRLNRRLEAARIHLKNLEVQRQKQVASLVEEKLSREEIDLPDIDIVGF